MVGPLRPPSSTAFWKYCPSCVTIIRVDSSSLNAQIFFDWLGMLYFLRARSPRPCRSKILEKKPFFCPSAYCFSSSMAAALASWALASLEALAMSMPNTWIVSWSEVAAINREFLLNCRSLISALSAPLRNINGHVGFYVSTFQIRIKVPFSLAVANRSP